MKPGPFDPSFEELPERLALFPLSGVLLLPRGRLPLNIFEPRYLEMIRDALASPLRLIGMIQPKADEGLGAGVIPGEPALSRAGCAGRIVSFAETGDGRYLIELKGVARFSIRQEPPRDRPYRIVIADWAPYRADLEEQPQFIDRERVMAALKPFFAQQGVKPDWRGIEGLTDDRLVITMAMLAPFAAAEKQALLEAADTRERAEILIGLMEMAVRATAGPPSQLN
jgi:uncharacterized protein